VSKRILLLADDSVTIQKVVNLTFADEGIDVVTVGDGDSAMQKITELSPDVVLADVHMPGLSGYQICEIVRENPATRSLPIVLLVGSFEPFDESEAARVGANAYLTKPFQSIRQLVTQVTDLMQSAAPEYSQPEPAQPEMEEVEQPPTGKVPDTTDIDSLYHQSFGGPGTAQVSAPVSEPAADAAIEESYNAYGDQTYSETPTDTSATAIEESYNAYGDQTYSETPTDTSAATPPYVDAGMDDEMIETSHVGGAAQPVEEPVYDQNQPQSEYSTEPQYNIDPNTTGEQSSFEEVSETGWQTSDEGSASLGAFDSFAEDRRESPASEETPEEPVAEFDEFSRTEQIPASITASAFNLDDLEILDLPPLENGQTQEYSTTPRSEADGGGKEIVSLSPELMDILVQRVVDKLSKDK